MQLIALEMCGAIAGLVFLSMMRTIARHRAQHPVGSACPTTAWAEYLWAVIPWVMIAACAVPTVRLIAAS